MQVWTGAPAGHADLADGLSALYSSADLYTDRAQVAVHREQPLAVIDDDGIAIEEIVAGIHDRAIPSCEYRCARGRGDVHAGMRIARLPVEHAAQSK